MIALDVTERVALILKEKKITQLELCKATGITKSTMNYILTNHKHFDADHIIDIANRLGVSVSWLLTGEDNKDGECNDQLAKNKLTSPEEELLKIYRILDREGQTMVLATAYQHRDRLTTGKEQR